MLPAPRPSGDLEAQREELSQAFAQLLEDANYVEMPWERIIACAEYQSQIGVSVKANLSDYAQLQVFYRGIRHEAAVRATLATPWKRRAGNGAHLLAGGTVRAVGQAPRTGPCS